MAGPEFAALSSLHFHFVFWCLVVQAQQQDLVFAVGQACPTVQLGPSRLFFLNASLELFSHHPVNTSLGVAWAPQSAPQSQS